MCETINKNFDYTNEERKILEDKDDSQFNDYRDNDEEARTEHINKELNKLPIHKKIQKLTVNDVMMDFDAKGYTLLLCGMKILFILKYKLDLLLDHI